MNTPFPTRPGHHGGVGHPVEARFCVCEGGGVDIGDSCLICGRLLEATIRETWATQAHRQAPRLHSVTSSLPLWARRTGIEIASL